MNISMYFFSVLCGHNRTHSNLPFDLGEQYFEKITLSETETHVSLRTTVHDVEKPAVFSDGATEVHIPADRVTLKWDDTLKNVTVTTINESPLEAYNTHKKYCKKYEVQGKSIFGKVVLMPKSKLVETLLICFIKTFNIGVVIQPTE
jgi:hypothetical protein